MWTFLPTNCGCMFQTQAVEGDILRWKYTHDITGLEQRPMQNCHNCRVGLEALILSARRPATHIMWPRDRLLLIWKSRRKKKNRRIMPGRNWSSAMEPKTRNIATSLQKTCSGNRFSNRLFRLDSLRESSPPVSGLIGKGSSRYDISPETSETPHKLDCTPLVPSPADNGLRGRLA